MLLSHHITWYRVFFKQCFLLSRFEGCWPTLAKDAAGVVLVFDPDDANQDKDLEAL